MEWKTEKKDWQHAAERAPTSVESIQRFQYPPLEGGAWILDAWAQAEDALELARAVQQLLVGRQLWGGAEHGGHAVDELRHQAGVAVVGLAEVIRDYLHGQNPQWEHFNKPGQFNTTCLST